jgi:hypothetical protein
MLTHGASEQQGSVTWTRSASSRRPTCIAHGYGAQVPWYLLVALRPEEGSQIVPRSSKTRDLFQLKHCAAPRFGLYLGKQHIDMCESRYTTKCSAKAPGHGLHEARPTRPTSLCSSMWPWASANGLSPTRIAHGYSALVSCYLSVTLSPEIGNETEPSLTETSVPVQLLWCFLP